MLSAKVILDSVSPNGVRLTTQEVTFHRFMLPEFNTHRVFSRNSASSRAIPFHKQLQKIMEDPALPIEWRTEQSGMVGGQVLDLPATQIAIDEWLEARNAAAESAKRLAALGVHKSLVNRIIEPFMWHTVIVSGTDWDGFWNQRCSHLAQPEIMCAADEMRKAYDASTPTLINNNEWHLPYIDQEDYDAAEDLCYGAIEGWTERVTELLKQVSAARCARVSYLTHDGVRSIKKDLELYQRLVTAEPPHWSPLEHVATPASYSTTAAGEVRGNFYGWHQLRHWSKAYA